MPVGIVALDTPGRVERERRQGPACRCAPPTTTLLSPRSGTVFDLDATTSEGEVTILRRERRGVRASVVRRARRTDNGRECGASDTRRCVHVLHRSHDPRRRGHGRRPVALDGDALAWGPPMTATKDSAAITVVGVRVASGPAERRPPRRAHGVEARTDPVPAQPHPHLHVVGATALFLFVLGTGLAGVVPRAPGSVDYRTFMFRACSR